MSTLIHFSYAEGFNEAHPSLPPSFYLSTVSFREHFAAGLVTTASVLPSNLPRIATSGP